jgi:sugar lactone lactonase YvrE
MTAPPTSPPLTAFVSDDLLGESPCWNADRGILSRADIHGGALVECDPVTGEHRRHQLGTPLGFAIPRAAGGYVAGIGLTVNLVDADFEVSLLVDFSEVRPDNRFNDATCDGQGRLWAGTMSAQKPRKQGDAALYRVDPDGAYEEVLSDLTLSNGMDWLDDGSTLLHIDSDAHRIDRYDVDVDRGRLSRRRTFTELEPDDGLPDGMTVDVDNHVWVAFFFGTEVRRYDPEGAEVQRIRTPVSCPTSVAFGGPDLADLFVTTSRHRLSTEDAAVQQLAGSLLRYRVGVAGRPSHRFAG